MEIINSPIKTPSAELEQQVLSIILNDASVISDVVFNLEPKDFTTPLNRSLFAAIKDYYQLQNNCDYRLLIQYIDNSQKYRIDNPAQSVVQIYNLYTDSTNLSKYVDLIKMNSTVSHLKGFANALIDTNIDFDKYNEEIWELQKKFLDIINSKTSSSLLTTTEITKEFSERLANVKMHKNKLTGTTSGFHAIDEFTNGFQAGDLIILAARPSIGKTALALNMLVAAAKKCQDNECVVFFSLEMGTNQLMERMVSAETSISSSHFKRGTWMDEDDFLIKECMDKFNKLPLLIDESSNISILEIQTKLKQIANTKKIKMVVIDYLQLVQGSQKAGINRQQEVSQISRTLKSIARDIETPVIAIAQLSRKIEERKGLDKKPILSDLRESGSIEQDADIVSFLNYERDEIDNNSNDSNVKLYNNIVVVDFIIAKNRNGSTGEVKLLFEKQYGKYSNYSDNQ